jgi:hypothetical protein
MRRFAPIEMRELTDRHRPKRLIAIGEIRTTACVGPHRELIESAVRQYKRRCELL